MSSMSTKTRSKASTRAMNRGAARSRRRRKKVLAWVAAAALAAFVGYGVVAFRSEVVDEDATSGDTAAGTTYGFVAETGSPVEIAELTAAGAGTQATVEGTVIDRKSVV